MPANPPGPPTSLYFTARPSPPSRPPAPAARAPAPLPVRRPTPPAPPRGASTPAPAPPRAAPAPAPAAGGSSEVYLVGGCHREDDKKNHHDQTARHYYTSANRVVAKRAEALRKAGSPDKISVIMYEPAYEVRAAHDKKTNPVTGAQDPQFHRRIMEASARLHNYDLKMVRSKAEMLQEMAKATAANPMKNGGYFGHSNPKNFLLDYGQNPPPLGSSEDKADQLIGADDFKTAGVRFHPDAHFASYGCRQGEPGGMMEQLSREHHIKTTGSKGETRYDAIGQAYPIPRSANGYSSFKNGLPIPPLVVSPPPFRPKP